MKKKKMKALYENFGRRRREVSCFLPRNNCSDNGVVRIKFLGIR
jgi:hypothetical protein